MTGLCNMASTKEVVGQSTYSYPTEKTEVTRLGLINFNNILGTKLSYVNPTEARYQIAICIHGEIRTHEYEIWRKREQRRRPQK